MMEEGVLSYESPLYGRRTGQWELARSHSRTCEGFSRQRYQHTNPDVQCARWNSGIPEQFDPEQSLLSNIETHILSKGAFLYEEPEFLLRQELREPATYMAILEAIAAGSTRVTDIANTIGKDASGISRYLKTSRS